MISPYIYAGLPLKNRVTIISVCPSKIINTVCEYFHITENDLLSKSRKYSLSKPRSIAIGLISLKNKNIKVIEIGKMFNRNHSTIIYNREVFNDMIKFNKIYKKEVHDILEKL